MLRFYNARTLSFSAGPTLGEGEVWVDGGRIAYVGAVPGELPAFSREIDLCGKLIMPGFKNAHTHTAMVFFRSLADDMPLDKWLSEQIWPYEGQLTARTCIRLTKLGILEYLSSGTTACFDMYIKNDFYAKACTDAGFRTVICSALNRFDADPENIEREYLKFNNYSDLVSYTLGIHAEYTTPMERMEYMVSLAEKYKARATRILPRRAVRSTAAASATAARRCSCWIGSASSATAAAASTACGWTSAILR